MFRFQYHNFNLAARYIGSYDYTVMTNCQIGHNIHLLLYQNHSLSKKEWLPQQ